MKISIITATYNSENTIKDTIESVLSQTYNDLEYIIIDGLSQDSTLSIVKKYESDFYGKMRIISEKDNGIYDALNKGIKNATGDIIAFIHADDILANSNVLENVVKEFDRNDCELLYGDLLYVNCDNTKTIRYWKSEVFSRRMLARGWMPAHPTLYLKREIYTKIGHFDTTYKISADYDFILRVFSQIDESKTVYLPLVLVKMRIGGVSNSGFNNIRKKMEEDLRAIKKNKIRNSILVLFLKNLSKIPQLIFKQ